MCVCYTHIVFVCMSVYIQTERLLCGFLKNMPKNTQTSEKYKHLNSFDNFKHA